MEGIYRNNLVNAGVQIFHGRALVQDRNTVVLANGTQLQGSHILVATGSKPTPDIDTKGHKLSIDSNGFLDLKVLPKRVVVQGAGYIALVLACVLQRLGSSVRVVVRGDHIRKGFDHGVRPHLLNDLVVA